MKKKIILYLYYKFKAWGSYYHLQQVANIRRSPNAFIDDSLFLGEHSDIIVNGPFKELRIEEGVSTRRFCNFLTWTNSSLIIRKGVFFNNYCSINCLGHIEIGENTLFGEGVKLYDHNHRHSHQNGQLLVDKSEFKIGSIKIGKNCWLGSNVTVLNNVEIGDNVIIGANCLIYKSIPANSIVKANSGYSITDSNSI